MGSVVHFSLQSSLKAVGRNIQLFTYKKPTCLQKGMVSIKPMVEEALPILALEADY